MIIRNGERLGSVVDTTEVIVVRAVDGDLELTCGGVAMRPLAEITGRSGDLLPGNDAGTAIGKRYTRSAGDVELLVTKAGKGTLAIDGEALQIKQAKPLPASD